MNTAITNGSTTTPKYCSRCRTLLINRWIDYGNGQYLCNLCHAYPYTITPQTVFPPLYTPPNNNYIEALNEIQRLNAALETMTDEQEAKSSEDEAPLYEQMKDPAFGLDDGIRDAVVLLNQHGIDTYESCEGGVGHCYTEPTVAFHDDGSNGMHALGVCLQHGLPVSSLQQVWQVSEHNTIYQIAWRIVFFKKVYYGRSEMDEEKRFLRGNVIMRAYANDMTEEQWQQIKQVLNVGSVYD